MARAYFCCYYSYSEYIEDLTDEQKGRLFSALMEYAAHGTIPDNLGEEKLVFKCIKVQIDRDAEKYDAFCEKQKKNIEKRWEKKPDTKDTKHTNVYRGKSGIPTDTKHTNEKEKEKEKEKENDINPLFSIPLNDDTTYGVSRAEIDHFKKLYPMVNVEAELYEMVDWCVQHPSRRKTRRGVRTFINQWLGKEQDRGGAFVSPQPAPARQSNADTLRQMIKEGVFSD